MLSIIGFATILIIVLILIQGKMTPIIPLVIIPLIGSLVAGFKITEVGNFFSDGLISVIQVAVMFIFAILFFGIMQDAGLFDPIIDRMIAVTHGNVITISVGTVLIAAIAQLDGSGASTFLITIPALLPIYRQMKMSPYLLLLLIGGSASIMNMIPWGGPLGRAASVLNVDVTELWRPLIPIQVIGIVLMIALAVFLGMREKRRIIESYGSIEDAIAFEEEDGVLFDRQGNGKTGIAKTKKYWLNVLLTVAVIGVLVAGIIPAGLAFMIGVCLALPLNFKKANDQNKTIQKHAPNALTMATIILAAGSFLGILNGTGMLNSIAEDVVNILPSFIAPYLHLILGILGVPFDLLLSTDAYYFALLPVAEQIGVTFGIPSISMAYAMIIGNIVGTFVSPFSPALWLAIGLAGVEMGKHIRYSFLWMWGISIALVIIAFIMGTISV
ncbi:CitMHS family transporter [Bacillus norwichensis]|uniref:Citrate transporter n=1 Tax=Bacillus norwichensis TaxID=2762217 RepID=A0ABR8VNG2_9BACI|nr:citrate:proton symporter [Bacillus norwichensis]MBD8006299.1 citrate transporter [Bacillus norwichensis]